MPSQMPTPSPTPGSTASPTVSPVQATSPAPTASRSQPEQNGHQPQAGGDQGPPTSRLARMALDEKKPVVHRTGSEGK